MNTALHNIHVHSIVHLLSLLGDILNQWMILPDEILRGTLTELFLDFFLFSSASSNFFFLNEHIGFYLVLDKMSAKPKAEML